MKAPHGNTVIWRYMSFEKFADMILRKKITFPRADKFPDRSELNLPIYLFDNSTKYWAEKLTNEDWLDFRSKMKERCHELRESVFLSCWSQNTSECYALWKIYLSGSPNGIAVKTTVSKLRRELDQHSRKITVGFVDYKEHIDLLNLEDEEIICSKRTAYSYENEVRFFITEETKKKKPSPYELTGGIDPDPKYERDSSLDLEVDLKNIISEIMISPFATFGFRRTVLALLKHHSERLSGLIKNSLVTE